MNSNTAHFIWLGGDLPDAHAREIDRFKALNPTLKVRLWQDVPAGMPSELREVVNSAAPMLCQKADIIRVWLLHEYGGMYFDTDIAWVGSVEPLRSRTRLWASRTHQHVSNFALGAAAGDPLLALYLRLILERAESGAYRDRAYYGLCCIAHLVDKGLEVLPRACFAAVRRMPHRLDIWREQGDRRELIAHWADCPLDDNVYGLHIGVDSRN